MIKKILLWLWQLPQNIIGLLVILFSKAKSYDTYFNGGWHKFYVTKYNFGVSLGDYIIIGKYVISNKTEKHEWGHHKQSLYFGWLYLLLIGVPSASGNIWDRVMHKSWTKERRYKWYYNQLWEKWADKLGGVER